MCDLFCTMLDLDSFYRKTDEICKIHNKALLVEVLFARQLLGIYQPISQDEEKLILDGWQGFLEKFPFPCYGHRFGWFRYLVLSERVEKDADLLIQVALKEVFKEGKEELYPHLWRVAFTSINESQDCSLQRKITDFLYITDNAIRYHYPSERLFQIHIDEQRATPFSLG